MFLLTYLCILFHCIARPQCPLARSPVVQWQMCPGTSPRRSAWWWTTSTATPANRSAVLFLSFTPHAWGGRNLRKTATIVWTSQWSSGHGNTEAVTLNLTRLFVFVFMGQAHWSYLPQQRQLYAEECVQGFVFLAASTKILYSRGSWTKALCLRVIARSGSTGRAWKNTCIPMRPKQVFKLCFIHFLFWLEKSGWKQGSCWLVRTKSFSFTRFLNLQCDWCVLQEDLFQQPGLRSEFEEIRDCLDTGEPDSLRILNDGPLNILHRMMSMHHERSIAVAQWSLQLFRSWVHYSGNTQMYFWTVR